VLDLVSSSVSHLLDEAAYAEVISHGINTDELAANSRLAAAASNTSTMCLICPKRMRVTMLWQYVGARYLQYLLAVLRQVVT